MNFKKYARRCSTGPCPCPSEDYLYYIP